MRLVLLAMLIALAVRAPAQTAPTQATPDSQHAATQTAGDVDLAALEQSFLNAVASEKADAVAGFLSPDFVSVAGKIHNRSESLELLSRESFCSSQPIVLSHPQVASLSKDVAIIVYQTTLSGSCGTRKGKLDLNVSSVWVRRNGNWQMQMHTQQAISGFAVQGGEKASPKQDDDADGPGKAEEPQ
jgi:hypothetical protein